jgi:hypothetical protein
MIPSDEVQTLLPRPVALGLAAALIIAGWVLILLLDASPGERVQLGLYLGTLYGQATLAAVWTVLGTGPLVVRVPLVLGWVVALVLASVASMLVWRHDYEPMFAFSTLGQSLLALVPLLLLRWKKGIAITDDYDPRAGLMPAAQQFGIGQLMILTAIIAALLGVARVIVPRLQESLSPGLHEAPAFAFVVLTNMVLTLPLALAALLPHRAILAGSVAIGFAVAATIAEVSLIRFFAPGAPAQIPPEVVVMFWVMNACQVVWVLAVLAILRLGGYRLAGSKGASPFRT